MKLSDDKKGVRGSLETQFSGTAHTWHVRGTGLDRQNEKADYVMWQKSKTGKSKSKVAYCFLYFSM